MATKLYRVEVKHVPGAGRVPVHNLTAIEAARAAVAAAKRGDVAYVREGYGAPLLMSCEEAWRSKSGRKSGGRYIRCFIESKAFKRALKKRRRR